MRYNIYCDESCHLPLDREPVMVLGAIRVSEQRSREVATRIREIKAKHGLHPDAEVKWGKLSPRFAPLYHDVVDYFFDDDDLGFRALVAHRGNLNPDAFGLTHDSWYYRMYYQLLSNLIESDYQYQVYLDIKDTRGGEKVKQLDEVLRNGIYDFDANVLQRIQIVRSHEVQAMQLADILIGAVGYANRDKSGSQAKLDLIERIRQRSGRDLLHSTPPREAKFNIFHWEGRASADQ